MRVRLDRYESQISYFAVMKEDKVVLRITRVLSWLSFLLFTAYQIVFLFIPRQIKTKLIQLHISYYLLALMVVGLAAFYIGTSHAKRLNTSFGVTETITKWLYKIKWVIVVCTFLGIIIILYQKYTS